jgi:predicted mannosyl-3-phosphoglycerate phosphatase (HAD superfamily)
MKRKSTVKRRLSSIVDPTQRRRKAVKKLSPKERLHRKRLSASRNRRKTIHDKTFDKGRAKVLHKRRTKKSIVAGKGKGKHSKLVLDKKKKGWKISDKVKLGAGAVAAGLAVFGAKKAAVTLGKTFEHTRHSLRQSVLNELDAATGKKP